MIWNTKILNKKDKKGDRARKNMQHWSVWNGGNDKSKMLGKKCNVVTASKECGRSHTSVTKND